MKQMIIIAIITILFIISALFVNKYLYNSATEIYKHIDNIIVLTNQNNWKNAYDEFKLSLDKWEKARHIWATLFEHEEIDIIESSMSKLAKYIITENISETLAESSNLKSIIEHIPQKFKLNIQNIF